MRIATLLTLFVGTCGLLIGSAAAADPVAQKLSFEQDVRPILKAYCLDCHGGDEKLSGQLDLRLRRFIVKGGETGAAIVPGDAAKSLLLKRVRSEEMPPGEKKLPPELIAILEQWIAGGAEFVRAEPEKLHPALMSLPRTELSGPFSRCVVPSRRY